MLKDFLDFEEKLLPLHKSIKWYNPSERRLLTYRSLSCSLAKRSFSLYGENLSTLVPIDDFVSDNPRSTGFLGIKPEQLFYLVKCFLECGSSGRSYALHVSEP